MVMSRAGTSLSTPCRTTGQWDTVAADATPRMAARNWTFVADKIIERQRVSRDGSEAQLLSPERSAAATKHIEQGLVPMFGWFKSERVIARRKLNKIANT